MRPVAVFFTSFITALSGALMPGPLLTVTIAQAAVMGFIAPVLLIAGHSLLELFLVVGLVFGLGRILRIKPVIGTISVLGGAMLVWMGWDMIPAALSGALDLSTSASAAKTVKVGLLDNPVITGMAVSISNPYWTIWWATVGMTLFGTLAQSAGDGPGRASKSIGAFYFGHISGDILWYLLLGAAITTGRQFISPAVYRGTVVVCGVFLMFLGASFLYLVASGKLWSIKMSLNWQKKQAAHGTRNDR